MAVHRSRYELERVLGRYGASDLAFVEEDANASIQFALKGHYVQLALPLPDPAAERFTRTPTGRPRTVAAQERAYEQALREHWRALLLAVRGKLQSVESGISSFENEFAGFLVPQVHENRNGSRKKPKAVTWLLGSSHSLAIALVAAFLVPASAVSAFALPPTIVDHLSAPFHGVLHDDAVADGNSHSVALGRSGWIGGESEPAGEESFVSALGDSGSFESDTSRPKESPSDASPEPAPSEPIGSEPSSASSDGEASAASDAPTSGNGTSDGRGGAPSGDGFEPSGSPAGGGVDGGENASSAEPEPDPVDSGEPAGSPPDPGTNPGGPPANPGQDKDKDNGQDNGNHNGADNGNNGNDNGKNDGTDDGHDNGNHNGADNGAKAGETGSGKGKGKAPAGQ